MFYNMNFIYKKIFKTENRTVKDTKLCLLFWIKIWNFCKKWKIRMFKHGVKYFNNGGSMFGKKLHDTRVSITLDKQ